MAEERSTWAKVLSLTPSRFIVGVVIAIGLAFVLIPLSRRFGWLVVGVIVMGLTVPASYLIRRRRERGEEEQEGSEVDEGSSDRGKSPGQEESP